MKTPEADSPPAMARKSLVSREHQFMFYLLKLLTLINFNFDLGLVEMDWPPAAVARKILNSREPQFIFYTCIWEACIWIPWNS